MNAIKGEIAHVVLTFILGIPFPIILLLINKRAKDTNSNSNNHGGQKP